MDVSLIDRFAETGTMKHLLFLNQVAQGASPIAAAIKRLAEFSDQQRFDFFVDLAMMVVQAHPLPGDVDRAIERSQLKPTFTPCVLVRKKALAEAVAQCRLLPRDEDEKSFRLLLALFQVADERRKKRCGNHCSHWWHQDLSRV